MAEDTQDREQMHEGYLLLATQKKVDGGLTLHFPKSNKFYFVLCSMGETSYMLQGFKNENAFKGKRKNSLSNNPRARRPSIAPSNIPLISLTSTVKVHCMDMLIGRKNCHVIILLNGTFPYYFKTGSDSDTLSWKRALERVAVAMEKRKGPDIMITPADDGRHITRGSSFNRDSGHGSNNSTPRSSMGSRPGSCSSLSSCPPSPSLIPTNICVEVEGDGVEEFDDCFDELPPSLKSRRELTKSIIVQRRERKSYDSTGGSTGKFEFKEEAPESFYDTKIRTSICRDDDEFDGSMSTPNQLLPPKRRGRRGSEPALRLPDPNYFARRRPETEVYPPSEETSSPPPLPKRPPSGLLAVNHDYENTRKSSMPMGMIFPSVDPIYEKCKVDRKNINRLQWEQTKTMDGCLEHFSKAELLDTVVLATIDRAVWVAGWKKGLSKQLYGKLRVGDKIRQINDQMVQEASLAEEFIRSTVNDEISVTLSRLPHALVLEPLRSHADILWGLDVKHCNEIKSVNDGPVRMAGLTPKTRSALSSDKTCEWIITEIQHRPVPIVKNGQNQEFVKEELNNAHRTLPLVVQPSDLIKKLASALSSKRESTQYC